MKASSYDGVVVIIFILVVFYVHGRGRIVGVRLTRVGGRIGGGHRVETSEVFFNEYFPVAIERSLWMPSAPTMLLPKKYLLLKQEVTTLARAKRTESSKEHSQEGG